VLLPDIYAISYPHKALEILSMMVPGHTREADFENARESDVHANKVLLTDFLT